MTWIVAFFGVVVGAVGILGFVRPGRLIHFIESAWEFPATFRFAIGVRLVLGVVFIIAAADCRFPQAIRILGIISIIGAGTIAAIGRERFRGFVAWWLGRPAVFISGWSMTGVAFGAFLVYAAR